MGDPNAPFDSSSKNAVTATQTALTPQAAAKRTQRRCHWPPQTCPPCLDLIPHLMLRRRRPLALLTRPPCPDRIPRLWTRIRSHPPKSSKASGDAEKERLSSDGHSQKKKIDC